MQIFADYFNNVLLSNGNLRIQLVQKDPENNYKESGTLIIPISQAANFINGLTNNLREIDEKIKASQEDQNKMS